MREYLFRGKRLDNGEWVYGYGAIDNEILTLDFAKGIVRVECVPETVGQFTGLADRKGNRAFTDSVIRYSGEYGHVVYGVVRFGEIPPVVGVNA